LDGAIDNNKLLITLRIKKDMKTIKTLLLLSLSILLFSCGDDDNKDFNFNTDLLNQTQWSGILVESYVSSGEIKTVNKIDIGFIFYTTEKGRYEAKTGGDDFKYSVEGKMLIIKPADGSVSTELEGYWLLTNVDAKRETIELELGTGLGDSYKRVLTLTRKH